MTPPNHALQRTRPSRRGCHRGIPRAGSLSLVRYAAPQPRMIDDETWKRLSETGAAASRAQERINAVAEPIAEQLQAFRKQQERMPAGIAAALAPFRFWQEKWQNQLEELALILQRAAEVCARLPGGMRLAQDVAASRGWYLGIWDHTLWETSEVIDLSERGDGAAVEEWIANRTRLRIESIREGVIAAFPSRSAILDQAFDAHKSEHYAVSIPPMLAQADGIHFDLLEQHLFRRNSRDTLWKRLQQRFDSEGVKVSSMTFLFLRPLVELNSLDKSTHTPDDPFNRHDVLHGTDTAYPTEINSLRVIALLDFLRWVDIDLSSKAA